MIIYHLQLRDPSEIQPASSEKAVDLRVVNPSDGAVNQRFYLEVGGPWKWTDRAAWPLKRWQGYVDENPITTAVLYHGSEEIGYTEIGNAKGDVEIVNYGLLPAFIGKQLGGAALVEVLRFAWTLPGAQRVWLHTCLRDHPNALNNYRRRGMEVFMTEEEP